MDPDKKYELEIKELKKELKKIQNTEYTDNSYKFVKLAIINEKINELKKKFVKENMERLKEKEKYNRAEKKREDKKAVDDYDDYMKFRI